MVATMPTMNIIPGPGGGGSSQQPDIPDYEIVQGDTQYGAGSGGGPATDGGHGALDGGGGAGFVAGFISNVNFKHTDTTSNSDTDFGFTVSGHPIRHVYSMVLCGGSGGGYLPSSPMGSVNNRATSGAGGGAWGNGGSITNNQNIPPYAGPGGTFGQGGNASGNFREYGGNGAWAIIDYSTGDFRCGTGGGDLTTEGYAELLWIESKPGYYNVKFKIYADDPIVVTFYKGSEEFGSVQIDPEHNEIWIPDVDSGDQISVENNATSEMKSFVLTYDDIRRGINVSF